MTKEELWEDMVIYFRGPIRFDLFIKKRMFDAWDAGYLQAKLDCAQGTTPEAQAAADAEMLSWKEKAFDGTTTATTPPDLYTLEKNET